MIRFSKLLPRIATAITLTSLLLLAGCHMGGTKDTMTAASMQGKFGLTIEAYKDGQFMVDGAVLSAIDTGSHFAYLKDQGRLPKTVLLLRSDDSKIRKVHLQYMARMVLDYGFTAYYDDGGTLKEINPVDTKARRLEDHHQKIRAPEAPQQDHTGGGYAPGQG